MASKAIGACQRLIDAIRLRPFLKLRGRPPEAMAGEHLAPAHNPIERRKSELDWGYIQTQLSSSRHTSETTSTKLL